MIPAVPLIVRLLLSGVFVAIGRVAMAVAGWITPELDGRTTERSEVSKRRREL